MSLNHDLNDLREHVHGCLAVGIVDLSCGDLLVGRDASDDEQGNLDNIGPIAANVFQADAMSVVENLVRPPAPGSAGAARCHEVVVVSGERVHIFQRMPRQDDLAMVSVCRRSVNIGIALLETRSRISGIETAS
jgi:hypothetical protein